MKATGKTEVLFRYRFPQSLMTEKVRIHLAGLAIMYVWGQIPDLAWAAIDSHHFVSIPFFFFVTVFVIFVKRLFSSSEESRRTPNAGPRLYFLTSAALTAYFVASLTGRKDPYRCDPDPFFVLR